MRVAACYLENNMIGDVYVADTFFTRLRGLIGRDPDSFGGLLIKPCNQIHTCFMSRRIDVIYLDEYNKVIKTDENLPPFRFYGLVKGARSVLELSAGTAGNYGIIPGSQLSFR